MQREITNGHLGERYMSTRVMPEEDIGRLIILSTKQPPPLLTLDLRNNNLSQLPSNFTKLSTIQPPLQCLDIA